MFRILRSVKPSDIRGSENLNSSIHRQAQWESLGLSIAACLVVGAGILGLWTSSTRAIRENYQHYLIGLAEAAATLIDPDLHDSIRRPEQLNDPDYRRAVEPLRRMRKAVPDIHYIFTVVRDGSRIRFVLDSGEPGDQAGVMEFYDGAHPALWQALGDNGRTGVVAANDKPVSDKWNTFMTGAAPLLNAAGHEIGAVGIDVDATVYLARLESARNWALIGLVPAGVLIGVLGVVAYRIRLRGLLDAQAAIDNAEAAERAVAVLVSERKRLGAVIEGTGVGVWEWDLRTDLRTVDERCARMIGYEADNNLTLTRQRMNELVHPEDITGMRNTVAATLASDDAIFSHEFRIRHADGHWIWLLTHGKVLEWDEHGRAQRMAGVYLDVSKEKATELSLQESEIKFRSLFELSPTGIALRDCETGRFLQVNDALVAPTGYTREELLQMTAGQLFVTPAESSTVRPEEFSRTDHHRFGPYETLCRRKDGSTYAALKSGIRMTDATGRAIIWSIVQDISERKEMELALAEAARRDRLTGLANRAVFMDRLQRALDRVRAGAQSLFIVLFLDFDRFKLINDTLGHEAGDELLRQIARRLRSSLRAVDTLGSDETGNVVARFGGDEFLVLLNDLHQPSEATAVAQRLLDALAPPYQILGREQRSSASIGIVTSDHCRSSADDVLRNADVAMYEAKRAGRACSMMFNDAMHTRLARHVAIEESLHEAIGTDQLSLAFQPIVEIDSGALVSAEALLRWHHPQMGEIPPAEFIAIAEESGLIVPLGHWVLRAACKAFSEWQRTEPSRAPRMVSVNISRAELALGRRLRERVVAVLQEFRLSPSCLQLEVTEREVMRDPDASVSVMRELRELGVHLAMDDFGTGTSSLKCLQQYPFDTIKIDRSFIQDLRAVPDVLAVIHATVGLITNLGMTSVAEGVEESGQLAILQSLGCSMAQGYLFSAPVSAEQLPFALESAERPALLARGT